jgi:hypothetical protein
LKKKKARNRSVSPARTSRKAPASATVAGKATATAPTAGVVVFRAFLLSLLAFPTIWALHQSAAVAEHAVLFITGIVTLAIVSTLMFVLIGPAARKEPYIAFFALFAFTSLVDAVLAATIHGATPLMEW